MKTISTLILLVLSFTMNFIFAQAPVQHISMPVVVDNEEPATTSPIVLQNAGSENIPHKLFVIGNSTASVYYKSLYPRTGWGQILQAFFNTDSILVVDKAISGRSSKSFYTDVAGWPTLLSKIGSGDFLFIEFGHNDEKIDDTIRFTDPYTTFKEYLSLYIDSARARGALPVLLTPIHRNGWLGDQIIDSHGDYAPAMRALASEKKVPLIDLTLKTEQLFESLGKEYVTNQIFMNLPANRYPTYVSGNIDNTHLQQNGAYKICKLIIAGINEINTNDTLDVLKNSEIEVSRVEALAEPFNAGVINGKGIISAGSTVNLTPVPKSGFIFLNWTENDTMVSKNNILTFPMDTGTRNFTANFIKAYNVKVKQNPDFNSKVVGEGYYGKDSIVTIHISPIKGYRFIQWTINDTVVSTDTVYSFTMGEKDLTIYANFEKLSSHSQTESNDRFRLFTNQASNKLAIRSESIILKVELIDLAGKIIAIGIFNAHEVNIDLSQKVIAKTICIARVTTNEKVYISKVRM